MPDFQTLLYDVDAEGVQGVNRLARLLAHLVRQPQRPGHLAVDQDVQDDGAPVAPRGRLGQRGQAVLGQQVRAADRDPAAAPVAELSHAPPPVTGVSRRRR